MSLASIGLADLLHAFRRLKPRNEATRKAVADILGYDLVDLDDIEPDIKPADGETTRPRPRDVPTLEPSPVHELIERDFRLSPNRASRRDVKSPIAAPRAAALEAGVPEDRLPRPPWQPLLAPRWSRALLSTIARVSSKTGPPDLEALVSLAAERRPVTMLPASTIEVGSGLDVLVDLSDGMRVFARDQEELVAQMRRVVGEDQLTVFRVPGAIRDGVFRGTAAEPEEYRSPTPSRPVVALTDLGAGAASDVAIASAAADWVAFAKKLRASGTRLLALCPYSERRWPPGVKASIDILQWDGRSDVTTLRRTLRRAR